MIEDRGHLHELLETLEAGVLSLERRSGDPAATIHRLFQSAHNLKSGLAMAGLERASKLFHGLEDGLDEIRRGRIPWSSPWADAVLEAVDRVRFSLDAGEDGGLDPVFLAPVSAGKPEPVIRSAAGREGVFRIEKFFLPGLTQEEFENHLILEDIASVGRLIEMRPQWAEYARATSEVVVRYVFQSPQSMTQLSELFFDPLIEVSPGAPAVRILVIEDEPLTAKLLLKVLEAYGEVALATDGPSALDLFQRSFEGGQRFDVVVLDLALPEVDGHLVLEDLRNYEESHGVMGLDRCLIFVNTATSDLKRVKASFRLQADRYFIKPLSTEQIRKVLEETLPRLQTGGRHGEGGKG